MSILTRHCLPSLWPLQGPQGEAPAWGASTQIDFNLNTIPLLTLGKFANYVPALMVTIYGTATADGTGRKRIRWKDLVYAAFQSFELTGAWHGRPLANQHMLGEHADVWETISMGYNPGSRRANLIMNSSVAANFRVSLYLPLSHLLGDDPVYSAQLALLYRNAQLQITTRAASQVGPGGETITIAGANVRCSAVMVPQDSLRLAPGCEWLLYQQQGATAGSDPVALQSFGDQTALEGVEPGAGVDTCLALTNVEKMGGSWAANNLTQFAAPFIGQTVTKHLDGFLQVFEQTSGAGQRPHDQNVYDDAYDTAIAKTGLVDDFSGLPYGYEETGTNGTALPSKLLFFPILTPGPRLQLTKVPTFRGTATYYRSVSAASGTDLTLIHQFKSFNSAKHTDFARMLVESGLAEAVLGTRDISPTVPTNDGGVVPPENARYLPVEWGKAKAA